MDFKINKSAATMLSSIWTDHTNTDVYNRGSYAKMNGNDTWELFIIPTSFCYDSETGLKNILLIF